ncbi:MAG: hypothetical protein HYT03_02880 [Candidatus Harrisonbacteria bacterium]|nr:hypothetical protein [Candidatus Harrisonbacteria bacterium]
MNFKAKKIELAQWLIDPDKQLELSTDWDFLEKKLEENGLMKIFEEIELPLAPILEEMKEIGIKVDLDYLAKLSKALEKEISELVKKIYKLANGEFNLNSPKQLSEVLFDRLKIEDSGVRKTKTGLRSTDAESLSTIKDRHPVIGPILKYRELFKIKSTYIDPFQELADKNNRLHTTFVQTGTGTGRLSSQTPNLQNIPIIGEWGEKVRRAFIADKGFSLVAFDYSQIELRVLATVSGDPKMTSAFKNDEDIHKMTAANVFNTALEKVTPEMRNVAKTLNFGVIYGMGADAFAKTSGLPREKAQEFIKEYFSDFADIKRWQEKTIQKARRVGYVENLNGRRRLLPNILSDRRFLAAEAERVAINMPIQGLAADIIKIAMIKITAAFKKKKWPAGKARMLLTIHDELVFEITDDILKEAISVIKSEMENAYQLAVPLKVAGGSGKNWSEL